MRVSGWFTPPSGAGKRGYTHLPLDVGALLVPPQLALLPPLAELQHRVGVRARHRHRASDRRTAAREHQPAAEGRRAERAARERAARQRGGQHPRRRQPASASRR